MELALPNPKTAAIAACDKTLVQIEKILPQADETQTDAILDWVRMFMEARRLRELWAKTSKLLRMAEVRWGELHPPQQGRRTDLETSDVESEVNIRPATMAEFRTMAENREIVEDVIDAAGDRIVTRSEVLREIEKVKPHVANNSGNNEWYTPPHFIEAARRTMGWIDLDPASSATANEVVKAAKFYSIENSGLGDDCIWAGNVWMNPPYSADLIGAFCVKLWRHVEEDQIKQACVLVNNATETQWFGDLVSVASAVCFPRKRVRFWSPSEAVGAPLQGQAIVYIGDRYKEFYEEFGEFGWLCSAIR